MRRQVVFKNGKKYIVNVPTLEDLERPQPTVNENVITMVVSPIVSPVPPQTPPEQH